MYKIAIMGDRDSIPALPPLASIYFRSKTRTWRSKTIRKVASKDYAVILITKALAAQNTGGN